jgi:hypothetical protein
MSFMDTAQILGNLGEFIGAIVIVATLIYLTLQVRQNTILLAGMKTEPLTTEEHIRLGFWLAGSMRSREFAWLQYGKGVIDEVQWHTEALAIQNLLLPPVSRGWWESVGRKIFSAEFARFVDDLIRDQPTTNELAEYWMSWTNRQVATAN